MSGIGAAALTLAAVLTASPYTDAREASLADGRPLVVLVGADWCPHCVTMKSRVIPQLQADGTLSRVAFAQVDATRQSDLAQRLMSGSGIPQLIMYRKSETGWKRSQLTGGQSAAAVRAFIGAAVAASKPGSMTAEASSASGG